MEKRNEEKMKWNEKGDGKGKGKKARTFTTIPTEKCRSTLEMGLLLGSIMFHKEGE